jgi:hypothetical protein
MILKIVNGKVSKKIIDNLVQPIFQKMHKTRSGAHAGLK